MVPLQRKAARKRHVQPKDASEQLLLSDRRLPPGSDETSTEITFAGLVTHTQDRWAQPGNAEKSNQDDHKIGKIGLSEQKEQKRYLNWNWQL